MKIPDWTLRLPMNLISSKAKDYQLDVGIVAAIVWQESRGSIYAARYETNYKYLVRPDHFAKLLNISQVTEEVQQKTSYSLMQIMGGTARWLGMDGALPSLFKPECNLYWGCKYLAYLQNKYGPGTDLVAAYNAGSPRKTAGGLYENEAYVDAVMNYYRDLA